MTASKLAASRLMREQIRSVRVQSCADGSMRVAIKYRKGSIHGVLTRLVLAAHIGDLINGSLK